MRILLTSHPEAIKYISKVAIVACLIVILFQVATSAGFISEVGQKGNISAVVTILGGTGMAIVLFAFEYTMTEVLRNTWKEAKADQKLSKSEITLLAIYITIFLVACAIDVFSTEKGASRFVGNKWITWGWSLCQLFLAEFFFHMYFHMRDFASSPQKPAFQMSTEQ